MAQLPQVDAKIAANQSVRSREFINGFFRLKIAIFSTASTLHSEGIYPKSQRLNANAAGSDICPFHVRTPVQ